MLKVIRSELLDSLPCVRHGFFTRQGGVSPEPWDSLNVCNSGGDNPENVRENRKRACEWFGVDEGHLYMPVQVHGSEVINTDDGDKPDDIMADGMITSKRGHVLGVKTADCVPLLLADPESGLIGAVHSGWRGALQGIPGEAVGKMEAAGAQRQDIRVAIGPCIQKYSYEVDTPVFTAFLDVNPGFRVFFEESREGHYFFDLPGLVRESLGQEGICDIDWIAMDTFSMPELFFSCRRNAHNGIKIFGDMMAGIMLER